MLTPRTGTRTTARPGTLRLDDLGYTYRRPGTVALQGVSAVLDGRVVVVLGPNGAGKSTLLGILATQLRPQKGAFALDQLQVVGREALDRYRRSLGWLPQSLGMFGGYTCAEFLRYAAWMRQVPAAQLEAAVDRALAAVDLVDRRDMAIRHLSGGMRRRLGLAQAVVNRPRLLVLDEPTVGLDPRQRADFRARLRKLSTTSQVILATHLVEDVAALADQVLILNKGQARFLGTLEELCGTAGRPSSAEVEAAYLDRVPASRTAE